MDRLVELRAVRQKRLLSQHPPQLRVLINEAVIRRDVGGPEVMREQLQRLVELSRLSTVSLHVLPFGVGAHAAMGNSFSILQLPEPPGARIVYLEDLWSADYVDKGPQLDAYGRVFNLLAASALDVGESIGMIEEVLGDLK